MEISSGEIESDKFNLLLMDEEVINEVFRLFDYDEIGDVFISISSI